MKIEKIKEYFDEQVKQDEEPLYAVYFIEVYYDGEEERDTHLLYADSPEEAKQLVIYGYMTHRKDIERIIIESVFERKYRRP